MVQYFFCIALLMSWVNMGGRRATHLQRSNPEWQQARPIRAGPKAFNAAPIAATCSRRRRASAPHR